MFGWSSKTAAKEDPYRVFRDRALRVERTEIGIAQPPADRPVWGVVMDLVVPNGMLFSLVSFADGTSSLYFGNGGAVIGGHSHDNVRSAAAGLLAAANGVHRSMKSAMAADSPEKGHVAFHARTDSGLLTANAAEIELKTGRHPLSMLFLTGHKVIAELRKTSEAKKSGGT